ncbi:MAG TPA: hypothetical protein VIG66_04210, partial [Noviherbaspirillum sp.]
RPETKPQTKPDDLPGTGIAAPPAVANTEPARIVSRSDDQDKPRADAQAKKSESKPKPPVSTSRKAQTASKPANNCKSAEVSERDASCLFIEQQQ